MSNNNGKPPVPPVDLNADFSGSMRGPIPLNLENLHLLPSDIEIPRYNPADVKTTILHIGPSNFARAHIAKMAHDVLNNAADKGEPLDFGIKAVSLRSADVKHALTDQEGLYCLTSKGAGYDTKHEVIGSIREVICARENADEIIAAAADPAIKIITMTVTQNGYDGAMKGVKEEGDTEAQVAEKMEKAKVKAGIIDPQHEQFSTISLLVHSLNERRKNGSPAPTIVSLDNMDGNGTRLKNEVTEHASLVDPLLSEWISHHVPFVSTMVDRITPKTTSDHVDEMKGVGVKDSWPVLTEPMPAIPLVIEDLSGKPDAIQVVFRNSGIHKLAEAGAKFSPEVAGYESMKLRMLNGAHMALGTVGTLCNHKTSDGAMQDPLVRSFVSKFMDQVIETLKPIQGVDYKEYKAELINRLDNPHICDPLTRLARNGISKVNDRLLAVAADAITSDKPRDHVTFAVAGWLQYAGNLDNDGFLKVIPREKDPNDKDAKSKGLVADINRNRATINGVFHSGHEKMWGQALMKNATFIDTVKSQFEQIEYRGIRHALQILTGLDDAPPAPAFRKDLH